MRGHHDGLRKTTFFEASETDTVTFPSTGYPPRIVNFTPSKVTVASWYWFTWNVPSLSTVTTVEAKSMKERGTLLTQQWL